MGGWNAARRLQLNFASLIPTEANLGNRYPLVRLPQHERDLLIATNFSSKKPPPGLDGQNFNLPTFRGLEIGGASGTPAPNQGLLQDIAIEEPLGSFRKAVHDLGSQP